MCVCAVLCFGYVLLCHIILYHILSHHIMLSWCFLRRLLVLYVWNSETLSFKVFDSGDRVLADFDFIELIGAP